MKMVVERSPNLLPTETTRGVQNFPARNFGTFLSLLPAVLFPRLLVRHRPGFSRHGHALRDGCLYVAESNQVDAGSVRLGGLPLPVVVVEIPRGFQHAAIKA